jgi:hypothetical protein
VVRFITIKDSQVATKFFTEIALILGLNDNLKTKEIFELFEVKAYRRYYLQHVPIIGLYKYGTLTNLRDEGFDGGASNFIRRPC